jgi:hypothetical protein
MYHPYFRGKQFELITVRETAPLLAASHFVPIIEPVKEALRGLDRTLQAVCEANGRAVVIVNPHHGDHSEDGVDISALLQDGFADAPSVAAGILLTHEMTVAEALACCEEHQEHALTLVHAGFTDGKALAAGLGKWLPNTRHVFVEKHGGGMLYRRHIAEAQASSDGATAIIQWSKNSPTCTSPIPTKGWTGSATS